MRAMARWVGWYLLFIATCICPAQSSTTIRQEVLALCDEPKIGLLTWRGTGEGPGERTAIALWKRAEALPDAALEIALDVLRYPEGQTEQRRVGAIRLAETLATRPKGFPSPHPEFEDLILRHLKSATWQDNKRLIISSYNVLRVIGSERCLKSLVVLLRTSDDEFHRVEIKSVMDSIAQRTPNGEALRQEALDDSNAVEEKSPAPTPQAKAEPSPVRSTDIPSTELQFSPESRSSTLSSGFLWTCAATAIALLVCLVVYWKRRP